jgi:hypothetical protein
MRRRGMAKKHQGKPRGMSYADVLAQKRNLSKVVEEAARDATVRVEADTQTQRSMWLMVCSIADAYGFGPKKMQLFFDALQANSDELEKMRTEVDEDYAYEKLRQKAEQVTGVGIGYLYEHEFIRS